MAEEEFKQPGGENTAPEPEKEKTETDQKADAAAGTEETKASEAQKEADGAAEEEPVTEEEKASAVDADFRSVEGEGKSSGGFFKKKKDKKDEKIEELTDRVQRQMAEFENFRKRTEKEKAAMFDMGATDVIEKILPVVDNFERGLAGADDSDPFVEGMNKVYKQLETILADLGVTAIEAEGKEFDPNLHNAVMHEENPDVGEGIITQELQKGYKYKDTVVRHSMVKVAN
jgi:molecular chaperone GrpE